ncbi:MAG: hypothetical protein JF885_03515 [Candidatus Dormibacteraeota bacterium]|nr:hypothetical protein [Candidatus Dormibacteraeota bacterium]MBJ7610866.1 hypothetical protein [Candidatus Dormibacteraeota bacterium]
MSGETYRFPAFYAYEDGSPGAWWLISWDDDLVSFTAKLVADREGEEAELLQEEEEPIAVFGDRPGRFLELDQLEGVMRAEEDDVQIPMDLAAQLKADRDRYLASLTPKASQELVERLAAS